MDEAKKNMPVVSIVIPVYRSGEILPHLVSEIEKIMESSEFRGKFELVLVCDASPDNSWQVIKSLAMVHLSLRGISLRKNAGQHNATMAGLNFCRGEYIIIMDDDLQHPPDAIPSLISELKSGADVCYTRYLDRKHVLWKRIGSRVNDIFATLLLGKPSGLYLSSYKALSRGVVNEIIKYDGPFSYVDGLILEVTSSIVSIEIRHQARLVGEGNYNFRRSISLWLKMATSFSVFPLRIMFIAGITLSILSLLVVGYVIIAKFMDPSIPAGWASLIAAVLFVGGVQMLGLGLIGEYLGRAYLKLNRKPQFVIRESTWGK